MTEEEEENRALFSPSSFNRPMSEELSEETGWCSFFGSCFSFGDKEKERTEYIIHMNDKSANAVYNYPSNFIKTSKYTFWDFLPLGLFFQFKKISNIYFLLNMIISFIPSVSPVSPFTAVMPLLFVLVVALIKEGYEDYKRHREDSKANSTLVRVLRNDRLCFVKSYMLHPGDVVYIDENDEVRADILLLSCSSSEGQCYIDTCNLDGETSLRKRRAADPTLELNSIEKISSSKLTLFTCQPEPGLHQWNGVMKVNGEECALSLDQFLYRGCCLRNTSFAWGMVIYAGVDTKLFRNLKEKPPKFSGLDKKLNSVIVAIGLFMFSVLFLISGLGVWWSKSNHEDWYIRWNLEKNSGGTTFGFRFLSYFILFSYFIPISLFVTIELCKVIQGAWMDADNEMMSFVGGRWRGCKVHSSNLNEELAMVRYIFSDKTGTLTRNIMEFKEGDILGYYFHEGMVDTVQELLKSEHPSRAKALQYFTALAMCNSIDPFEKEGQIVYEGSSPDEVALVSAAAKFGVKLIRRTTKVITLLYPDGQIKDFRILACLEFTPERKMMSIVVEDEEGRILLYNKGADSFVEPQLEKTAETSEAKAIEFERLGEMSRKGLRTLLFTQKEVTRPEFEQWNLRFIEAGKLLADRVATVDAVCLELERNLRLIGSSAIEDRLQERVPETISFFLAAGVKVWVLTGDKRETAVTVAATSNLLDPRTTWVGHIDIGTAQPKEPAAVASVKQALLTLQQHLDNGEEVTLVIDGPALDTAMEYEFDLFFEISHRVYSGICCRLTPLQKANVVSMFQKLTGKSALAIGDGANDVSMILEGCIGVGIQGLEGSQAALSADYAITAFKDLQRLCAIHGQYSYYRNSTCILVSLYKNFVLSFLQVIFACYCGFSGQSYFDGWFLTFFNVLLTSISPFFMGIFEKDVPEKMLSDIPEFYAECSKNIHFNYVILLQFAVESVVHGLIIFYLTYNAARYRDYGVEEQLTGSMVSMEAFIGLVVVVLVRFGMHIRYWTWVQAAGLLLSLILTVILVLIYSVVPFLLGSNEFYKNFMVIGRDPRFWFLLITLSSIVVAINLTVIFVRSSVFPTNRDQARSMECLRNVVHSPK